MSVRKITPEAARLIRVLEQAEEQVEALRGSVRWRLGSAAVELARRIRGKPPAPSGFDHLAKLFAGIRERRGEIEIHPATTAALPIAGASSSVAFAADIVVCVHDAPEYLEKCLESLVECTNLLRHHIILVDDGSTRQATDWVLKRFVSQVPSTFLRNEEQRGYTVAANQGIAAGSNDYIVLLNSDTVVTPGWLDKLIRCAQVVGDAAVVGPLSNAASWQSIPKLTEEGVGWCVNALPEHLTAADVAAHLDCWSASLYPSSTLINGFCYMMSRRALKQVGGLDEGRFPSGYGEEDDFSLRCVDHGFRLYVADDCYVYHAKSKSFTPERRAPIVRRAKVLLDEKHGLDKVRARLRAVEENEELVRARTFASLVVERAGRPPIERDLATLGMRIAWVVPHLGEVGGVRRIIEMSNRLVRWGCEVELLTPDGSVTGWLPILGRVVDFEASLHHEYDVVIVTDPDVVDHFLRLAARRRIIYHLGAYMLYRPASRALTTYYEGSEGCVHLANSKWTADRVEEHTGVEVKAIVPGGVDKRLFHPRRRRKEFDVVAYGSRRPHKDTATIVEATRELRLLRLADLQSSQRELADHISSARVFASACWHEGFNFLPLEAMSCGIPVVMTDDGGSREYARDGENALVVPVKDPAALRQKIDLLLSDQALRTRLIANGLSTAWRFEWDQATADFADLVGEMLER